MSKPRMASFPNLSDRLKLTSMYPSQKDKKSNVRLAPVERPGFVIFWPQKRTQAGGPAPQVFNYFSTFRSFSSA
jgi:hypothetical protein